MTYDQGSIVRDYLASGPMIPRGETIYVNIGLNEVYSPTLQFSSYRQINYYQPLVKEKPVEEKTEDDYCKYMLCQFNSKNSRACTNRSSQ